MTQRRRTLSLGLALGAAALPAAAADLGPAAYAPPSQPMSFVSELRVGGSVQDPGSAEGKLRGFAKENVKAEVLLAAPVVTLDPFWQAFVPRPTVGGSYNTGGRTSYAYLGATWRLEVFPETLDHRVFIDGFFGGSAHDGYTGPKPATPYGFNTLGCSPLFREAAALGFRLSEHWRIMATIEHMSNAGLCANNRGLTNYGGMIGYAF